MNYNIKESDALKAQVVGKNIFYKDITNKVFFIDYFDFLLQSAVKTDDPDVSSYLLKEAESSLQSYSEHCEMSQDSLDFIYDCNERIHKTICSISEENKKVVYDNNANMLKEISDLYRSLREKGKSDSTIINKIKERDSLIVKEAFDSNMERQYLQLSQDISSFITQSVKIEKRHANLVALQAYKEVYDIFNKEKKYKKEKTDLESLLRTKLFGHDLSGLDQEVVAYYNMVYNHIFSKVKDELKYSMVEWAIKYKVR